MTEAPKVITTIPDQPPTASTSWVRGGHAAYAAMRTTNQIRPTDSGTTHAAHRARVRLVRGRGALVRRLPDRSSLAVMRYPTMMPSTPIRKATATPSSNDP
jgi:hypothetical protein